MRLTGNETVRQLLAKLMHIGDTAPHQALDRQHGVEGISGGSRLGRLADLDAGGVITHRRRQDDLAIIVSQGLSQAAAHSSNQRVGGT